MGDKDKNSENNLWVFPCLCTMSALGCGLTAVRCASEGNFQCATAHSRKIHTDTDAGRLSVVFLFLSCLLDGHIALLFLPSCTFSFAHSTNSPTPGLDGHIARFLGGDLTSSDVLPH